MKIKIYCEENHRSHRVCPKCQSKGYREVSLDELIKPMGECRLAIDGKTTDPLKCHIIFIKSCLNLYLLK